MMFGGGLGELLPLAMAIAINPIPVIACILILFTARARVTGPLFLVGWVAGITLVTTAAFIVSEATYDTGVPATGLSAGDVIFVALGFGLIALGIKQWRSRPGPDEEPSLPAWTSTLDDLSPLRAVGFGLLLSAANPKHIALAIAAALVIDEAVARGGSAVALIVLFVFVASLSVTVPVVYYLVGGDGARQRLEAWRSWLALHSSALLAAVVAVIGVAPIGTGVDGLLGGS